MAVEGTSMQMGQLLMIELVVEYTEVIEDGEESDEEGMESNENNNSGTFTLNALTGYSNPQTMCVSGISDDFD
jgi:hypothetical protein